MHTNRHAREIFSHRYPHCRRRGSRSYKRAVLRFRRQSRYVLSFTIGLSNAGSNHVHENPGVCVTTSACSSAGGVTISGACPSDPDNVKCCSKASCTNGSAGNCRWTSDCAGSSVANQCPGPGGFKCCSSAATGFGGYATPSYPSVGACKAVAVVSHRTNRPW